MLCFEKVKNNITHVFAFTLIIINEIKIFLIMTDIDMSYILYIPYPVFKVLHLKIQDH